MFANPLIYIDKSTSKMYENLHQTDYDNDIDDILSGIDKLKVLFRYQT